MNGANKIWVVEAHDLGALQVRTAEDAIRLNRKRWLSGNAELAEDRTGKADRMLVGMGGTIDEALLVERELKREKGKIEKRETSNTQHSTFNGGGTAMQGKPDKK